MRTVHWFLILVVAISVAGCAALKGPIVAPEEDDVLLTIANPSFEESHPDNAHQPLGWFMWTGGVWGESVTLESTRVVSGERALAIHTATEPKNTGVASDPVPAIPGRTYRASVQAYIDANSGGTSIYIDFLDGDKKRIQASSTPTYVRNQWTTIAVEAEAPEGTE